MQAARQDQGIALATLVIAGDDIEAYRRAIVAGREEPFALPHQGPNIILVREENWNASPVERFRSWLIDAIGASA